METKWQIVNAVLSTKVDDEVVLMSVEADSYFCVEPVGSRIWELLEKQPLSVNELVRLLMEEYEVDEQKCNNDVQAFIDDMAAKQLILPVQ